MTVPKSNPDHGPEPELQRVRSGRRAAIAVGIVALVVVGALAWKPWDTGSGAPDASGRAPTPAAAVATRDRSTPSPAPQLVQTPDVAIPDPTPSAGDLVTVSLNGGPVPGVACTYGKARKKLRPLSRMTVASPIVALGPSAVASGLDSITFRVEIEANVLQGIFSAEWQYVETSGVQSVSVATDAAAPLRPIQVRVAGKSWPVNSVFRAALVIGWNSREHASLGEERLYPASYGTGNPEGGTIAEGCPAWISAT